MTMAPQMAAYYQPPAHMAMHPYGLHPGSMAFPMGDPRLSLSGGRHKKVRRDDGVGCVGWAWLRLEWALLGSAGRGWPSWLFLVSFWRGRMGKGQGCADEPVVRIRKQDIKRRTKTGCLTCRKRRIKVRRAVAAPRFSFAGFFPSLSHRHRSRSISRAGLARSGIFGRERRAAAIIDGYNGKRTSYCASPMRVVVGERKGCLAFCSPWFCSSVLSRHWRDLPSGRFLLLLAWGRLTFAWC